jgi:hypothetical protein
LYPIIKQPQFGCGPLKNMIMKKRFFALALIIGVAVVSVTSGCYVGYGGRPHHHYYHGGY